MAQTYIGFSGPAFPHETRERSTVEAAPAPRGLLRFITPTAVAASRACDAPETDGLPRFFGTKDWDTFFAPEADRRSGFFGETLASFLRLKR